MHSRILITLDARSLQGMGRMSPCLMEVYKHRGVHALRLLSCSRLHQLGHHKSSVWRPPNKNPMARLLEPVRAPLSSSLTKHLPTTRSSISRFLARSAVSPATCQERRHRRDQLSTVPARSTRGPLIRCALPSTSSHSVIPKERRSSTV